MSFQDPGGDAVTRARALLSACADLSRGELKQLGAWLDAQPLALREAVRDLGRAGGVSLPDQAATWPGKRLLRRARGVESAARRRSNPIRRDEGFCCAHCGEQVPPHGRSARDHCPWCLRSLHVDGAVPGDRAADCGGLLDPVSAEQRGGRWVLRYRCRRCGARRLNQMLDDGDVPDVWELVVAVASGQGS